MQVRKCCALLSKSKQCALVLFNANLIQAITVLSTSREFSTKRHPRENCRHSIYIQPPLLWLTTVTAMAVSTSNKSAVNGFLHRKECFVAVQCVWVLPTHLTQNSLSFEPLGTLIREVWSLGLLQQLAAMQPFTIASSTKLHWCTYSDVIHMYIAIPTFWPQLHSR